MSRDYINNVIVADIPSFPGYKATRDGGIWSERRGIYLSPSRTNVTHDLKVNLMRNSRPHTRTVKILMAEAFVRKPEVEEGGPHSVCDAVIFLDGDHDNLVPENLDWRPRWYATDYHKQIRRPDPEWTMRKLIWDNEGQQFECILDAAKYHGVLPEFVTLSIEDNIALFPRGVSFYDKPVG